ncbi:MAG: hypothetical protein IPK19_38395 [Chloroflexi bacterium]|nr:hypothetical protein [Chloroflexota bacterium]
MAMIAIGGALGAVQFLPLFGAASNNFRVGGVTYDQIQEWAHPLRDVVQFSMPNFYGSPAQHTYFDLFDLRTVSLIDETILNAAGQRIVHTEWGMKNYVEGALYVGILPLILAGLALLDGWVLQRGKGTPYRLILALLAAASLTFMFGLPTYIPLLVLPGIDQLHSPFRWVFPLTFSVAALAGFGMDAVLLRAGRWSRRIGIGVAGLGALVLVGLLASRLLYDQIAQLVERLYGSLAKAADAFADARMFYSVEFLNAAILGAMLLASGVVIVLLRKPHPPAVGTRPASSMPDPSPPDPLSHASGARGNRSRAAMVRTRQASSLLAVVVIAADLMLASAHFNPASDPALLDFTPPAIEWLQGQPGGWRYTTIEEAGKPALFNANMTMRYGLKDIRGYESIIPANYVALMEAAAPQVQLEFNRVAPLYADQLDEVDWASAGAAQRALRHHPRRDDAAESLHGCPRHAQRWDALHPAGLS